MKVGITITLTIPIEAGAVLQTPFGPETITAAQAASGFYNHTIVGVGQAENSTLTAGQLQTAANDAASSLATLFGG